MISVLGPDLGRLAAPPSAAPFEGIRISMVDALISARAGGEPGHDPWRHAWEGAVGQLRDSVISDAHLTIDAAGSYSRFPSGRLARAMPDAEAEEILLNRLLAEGIPLERFEGAAGGGVLDRQRAAALEQAWDGATRLAQSSTARWRSAAAEISAWRRSMMPFWVISGLLVLGALLVSAWLGGFLPAPVAFEPVHRWWWSLAWP